MRPNPPFFKSFVTSVWIRLLRFSLISHKQLEDNLKQIGLTAAQFYVVATLGYAGRLPFGEIATKMMVTVSNLTGIVDRLEKKRLVSRQRDKNDRRVVYVVLTAKGTKLFKEGVPLFERSVGSIFATLDKAEQKRLSAMLRMLNNAPSQT